jgi:kynurenine formamidase
MPSTPLTIGSQTLRVVDLTQPVSTETEVFPGDPKIERTVFSAIDETGFEHYVHSLGDHAFVPHADAPNHQNEDAQGQGIETFALADEYNQCTLIDLADHEDAEDVDGVRMLRAIDLPHLEPHAAALREVTAIVVRTGAEQWRLQNRPFFPEAIPFFTPRAGEWLAAIANLRVVGVDSCTVDEVRLGAPVHTVHHLLRDKLIVESLVHLDEIPAEHRRCFMLQTALLKIVGATGGPVVARAYLCD